MKARGITLFFKVMTILKKYHQIISQEENNFSQELGSPEKDR